MNKLTLRTKLIGSFAIIQLLLLVIATVSYMALSNGAENFSQYRYLARDTNLTSRLQANILLTQMHVKSYIITGEEAELTKYDERQKKMAQFLVQAKKEIEQPELQQKIEEIGKVHLSYTTTFGKVGALQRKIHQLITDVLEVQGQKLVEEFTEIQKKGELEYNFHAVTHTGKILAHLQQARLLASQVIITPDQKIADQALAELTAGKEYIKEFIDQALESELQETLNATSDIRNSYEEGFRQVIKLLLERDNIMNNTLETQGTQLAQLVENANLALKGEQDTIGTKAEQDTRQAVSVIIISSVAAIFAAVLLIFFITRAVFRQLGEDPGELAKVVRQIAQGNLVVSFQHKNNRQNSGIYADMEEMASNLRQMFTDITTGITTLSSSAKELASVSDTMSANVEHTKGQSSHVTTASEEMSNNMDSIAAASEEASSNIQIVAAASEEMSATISEIAGNTEKSRQITEEAVAKATSASNNIQELGSAAENVGKVTETINEISEQTNLLALNATIEAARAGEAGKGFAVVANEIKDLAKQTAEATQDIRSRIEGMQSTTRLAVSEIGEIEAVINNINEIVRTIASAVEEQSVTTQEIVTNVNQASRGIQEVNQNVAESSMVSRNITDEIKEVDQATSELASGGDQVRANSQQLAQLANQLGVLVAKFKI